MDGNLHTLIKGVKISQVDGDFHTLIRGVKISQVDDDLHITIWGEKNPGGWHSLRWMLLIRGLLFLRLPVSALGADSCSGLCLFLQRC